MNYYLNYEYDDNQMTFFVSNDKERFFINEVINYKTWNDNKLKKIDALIEKTINKLIERCISVDSSIKITAKDKVNTKYNAINIITRIIKNNSIKSTIDILDTSIKDWYLKMYPNDDVGQTLSSTATFLDLNNLINSNRGNEVYSLLGGYSDSIIRERCFQKLAELTNNDYDVIYYKWLNSSKKEMEEELEK